jgi:hypothetical protein
MKARILLLVVYFSLPNFIMAQNMFTQQASSLSLNQKQINNHSDNTRISHPDTLKTMCYGKDRSLYVFRLSGIDYEDCINFYGISIGVVHENPNANFSGLALSLALGTENDEGNNISVNGINIGIFNTRTRGTINGISISGIGDIAGNFNGLQLGIIGTGAPYLNGLTLGGCMSQSIQINGIQLSIIINLCKTLNGIGISFINAQSFEANDREKRKSSGLVLGVFNIVDISGLSFAAINSGNSWLQIGLVNVGDSAVQIGLVNLDGNKKMGIPIINFNF